MPSVKYVANLSYTDGTGSISLGPNRVLVLGGAALEVSDAELSKISGKFKIEVVDQGEDSPVSVTKTSVTSVFDATSSSVVPVVPAVPAVPVVTVAPPATPVNVGSPPSTTSPITQLPTPAEGN